VNNQEFIQSGILESSVLGLLSGEDQENLKKRIEVNPELERYLGDMETNLQQHFIKNAVPPPPEVREILVLRNTQTEVTKPKHVFNRTKSKEPRSNGQFLDIEVNDTHIKVHKYWRPAFIAVFILSKIFLIAGLYYYFKTTSLQEEIVRLKTEIRP